MERAISEMERIKRAEEICAKRRNIGDDIENKKSKNIYKFLFQVLTLINIAVIITAVQNQKYIFTENFINQVSNYNVSIKEKIEQLFKNEGEENSIYKSQMNDIPQTGEQTVENNSQNENNEGIQAENNTQESGLVENEPEELSQMEIDARTIKENYSIIMPIQGTKTSGFGDRESSNSIVTSYHTGIDLSQTIGTVINSATTGIVTQVSSKGDYGKHLKIETENLTVLYAHCSKIYVSEGDEIVQGQPIAEVGNTRKFYWSTFAF